MVLQAILAKLGLGGLQGLSQGGGFGLGYGFMVRAGYDLYGQMRDKVMQALTGARYTPDTATSMMGTGGLMGLARGDSSQPQPMPALGGYKNSGMTQQQYEAKSRFIGGAHKMDAYLARSTGKSHQTISGPTNPIHRKTGREMSDWYYNNVYKVRNQNRQRYYDTKTFFSNFNL